MQTFWVLPSLDESRHHAMSTAGTDSPTRHPYWRQVALAAEQLGFDGIKLPAGRSCEDALVIGAALSLISKELQLMVGVRPAVLGPVVCARMASTLHQVSNSRLLLHLVSDLRGDPADTRQLSALFNQIPEISEDYVRLWLTGYLAELARLQNEEHAPDPRYGHLHPLRNPGPPILCGGVSNAAAQLSSDHADLHIMSARSPAEIAQQMRKVRQLASRDRREVRFAVRTHIVVRETESDAHKAARAMLHHSAKVTALKSRRIRIDQLAISQNLWRAQHLNRDGTDALLLGDAPSLAARLREFSSLGVDTLILSSYPHMDEMRRVAHFVLPLIRRNVTGDPLWTRDLNPPVRVA